jgi:alanine racemase
MNSFYFLPFYSRPTWIEINKNVLIKNISSIYNYVNTKSKARINICAVIKSNAYGHGIQIVGKILEDIEYIKLFGVASIEEAIILRKEKVKKPILLLGSIYPFENFIYLFRYNINPTVSSILVLKELDKFAKKIGQKIKFHLKIDTGMGRIGILPERIEDFINEYKSLSNVVCEGVYTHFSSAKEDKEYTLYQLKLFNECYKKLLSCGIKPKFVHTANSAASVLYPESYFNIIRPGLIIYGLKPFDKVDKYIDIHPVLSLKSKIVFLKTLPKGKYISYSKTYVTKKKTKVATIPIGYADGLLRKLSNKGKVLIKGKFCKIIGKVTMDMVMVDVSNIKDVKVGDEVVLIGKQFDKQIFVEDIADLCETINYEIVTLLSNRIPRIVV